VIKRYRPSNGTEGMIFEEKWCVHCERDKAIWGNPDDPDWGGGCRILADILGLETTDPDYPDQWRYCLDTPVCTAFVREGTEIIPVHPNQGMLIT
jgi:hypothetical protein